MIPRLGLLFCGGLCLLAEPSLCQTTASFEDVFWVSCMVELEDTQDSLLTLKDCRVTSTGGFVTTDYYEQGLRMYTPGGNLDSSC